MWVIIRVQPEGLKDDIISKFYSKPYKKKTLHAINISLETITT